MTSDLGMITYVPPAGRMSVDTPGVGDHGPVHAGIVTPGVGVVRRDLGVHAGRTSSTATA